MLVQVHVMATCSILAYILELSHLQYTEVVNVVHVHMDVQHVYLQTGVQGVHRCLSMLKM